MPKRAATAIRLGLEVRCTKGRHTWNLKDSHLTHVGRLFDRAAGEEQVETTSKVKLTS